MSIKHLSLGILGFDHAEEATGFYGAFAGVWAVAVLLGIGALSFRRFVLRPKALGKLSVTSGVVAAPDLRPDGDVSAWNGRRFPPRGTAWKINWWAHTLAFFALLVVIPQSKHLHLLLSPFADFLPFGNDEPSAASSRRRRRSGHGAFQGPGLEGRARRECLRGVRPLHSILSRKPNWRIAQPQGDHPRHAAWAASRRRSCRRNFREKKAGSVWIDEQDLFQCLSCGACEYVCPVGIEHVGRKILDLRRGLVSEGRVSNEKVVKLFTTMERAPHNPWGIMQDTRKKFIEGKAVPDLRRKAGMAFLAGLRFEFRSARSGRGVWR